MRGGQRATALPQCSDVDLLGDGQRIVDLDTKVSDRTLHLGVPEQQLNRPEVASTPIDQRCLGSPQRVGAEQSRIETDAGDPARQQARILAGGEASLAAAAMEQKIAGTLPGHRKVLVDRLTRLLGNLEPDRKTGLVLPNGRPLDGIAVWHDIFDPKAHHVATTQLAIDREVEERQIARAPCEQQSRPNGPDMLRLQRWLRSDQFALVPDPDQNNAIAFAERQGWLYEVRDPPVRRFQPKSYADRFRYDLANAISRAQLARDGEVSVADLGLAAR
jgi:hypothetical protein